MFTDWAVILRDCRLLLFQQLDALRKSQVRWHGMEIAVDLGRLDIDALEQKILPVNARSMRAIVQLSSLTSA